MPNRTVVITVAEILKAKSALRILGELGMRATSSFTSSRIAIAVEKEASAYIAQQDALIEKLGVETGDPDKPGQKAMKRPSEGGDAEKWKRYFTEIDELRKHEVEISIPSLSVSDMVNHDGDPIDVPHRVLVDLNKLILPPRAEEKP